MVSVVAGLKPSLHIQKAIKKDWVRLTPAYVGSMVKEAQVS